MAVVLKEIAKTYSYIFNELPNPQSRDWPLVSNPLPTLLIIAGYLYFVLKCGPKWMEKRQPFKLDRVLQIYNLFQILGSAYIMIGMFRYGWGNDYSFRCQPMDRSDNPNALQMTKYMYSYYLIKMVDLLDTVFFVLRKKQSQISFLHVYHHAGMVAMSWGASLWLGNGHASMIPFLNSIVHVIMYFYYFLTSISDDSRKYFWWKKHITQIQIFQFTYFCVHFGQVLFHNTCNFPPFVLSFVIPQNFFMLFLFVDFYVKAYIKKKK